jgi:hypothetical protein
MPTQGLNGGIASEAVVVTPSDTADNSYSYFYIGGPGNLAVIPEGGSVAVTYTGLLAGMYVWIRTKQVLAAGTTATLIIGHR